MLPTIGTKGKFTFKPPFNTKLHDNQIYTVHGVRSLSELHDSGENPYDSIYKPVGLPDTVFSDDVNKNVNIVIFVTQSGDYFYVPDNLILSAPLSDGVKYQELILGITLGPYPLNANLDLAKDTIRQTLYDVTGIDSTIEVIPASAIIYKTDTEDAVFMQLLNNRKTNYKSWRTKYLELLELYNKKTIILDELQNCIKTKL